MSEEKNKIVYLPTDVLVPHPHNPRTDLGDLSELADSIRTVGVLQNLTVVDNGDGTYTVIIGHRRTAAALMAGVKTVPCVVTDMTPAEQMRTMLLENMQRSDLTVYDQARGFQMLIDLGDSVDTISAKTGFSQTTVRRRLKMMELDQEKLKEVSSRQLLLSDFDRLAEIDSLEKRNEVLESIGTNNFDLKITQALRRQATDKNLPLVKSEIRKLKAHKIERSDTWGDKYDRVVDYISIAEWHPGDELVPADVIRSGKQLYYLLDEEYGQVSFYTERERAKPAKRPQSEIDREKYIADTREKLEALSTTANELRRNFVSRLRLTKANERLMLDGAVKAVMLSYDTYRNGERDALFALLGLEWDYGRADECRAQMRDSVNANYEKCVPTIIYSAFGNMDFERFYTRYSGEFPKYEKSKILTAAYDWLVSVGYEMSDDERMLYDGTHPLFVDKDKEETK